MRVNLIGLGLLLAGVIFLGMAGFGGFEVIGAAVLGAIGVICLIGGIGMVSVMPPVAILFRPQIGDSSSRSGLRFHPLA